MSNLETQAMNDAMSNKNMMDDPNWTAIEREAALHCRKNKTTISNNQAFKYSSAVAGVHRHRR